MKRTDSRVQPVAFCVVAGGCLASAFACSAVPVLGCVLALLAVNWVMNQTKAGKIPQRRNPAHPEQHAPRRRRSRRGRRIGKPLDAEEAVRKPRRTGD